MAQYIRKENYILRDIAGSKVLISIGNNIANYNGYIQLNETAGFIWEKLKEPITFEELVIAIEEEFDIGHEDATTDLTDFMQILKDNGMVDYHE